MPRREMYNAEEEVLWTLAVKGPLTWSEILRYCDISSGHLSGVSQKLQIEKKITKIKKNGKNKYRITPKGKRSYLIQFILKNLEDLNVVTEYDFDEMFTSNVSLFSDNIISDESKIEIENILCRMNSDFNLIDEIITGANRTTLRHNPFKEQEFKKIDLYENYMEKINILRKKKRMQDLTLDEENELKALNTQLNKLEPIYRKWQRAVETSSPKVSLIFHNWRMDKELILSERLVETDSGFIPVISLIQALSKNQMLKYKKKWEEVLGVLDQEHQKEVNVPSFPIYPGPEDKTPFLPENDWGWIQLGNKIIEVIDQFLMKSSKE